MLYHENLKYKTHKYIYCAPEYHDIEDTGVRTGRVGQ